MNIIHIGGPKTGSTTIQKHLFAQHKDLHYFGEQGDGCLKKSDADIIYSMINDDDIVFRQDYCEDLFQQHKQLAGDKTIIYSDVDIMTSPIATTCAKRLQKYLPDSKILVVIRNQFSAIRSLYVNHGAYLKSVPKEYYRMHVSFYDWMEYSFRFTSKSQMIAFHYNEIISVYEKLFGRDNIHVLVYEEFRDDPSQFCNKLSDVLGIDFNYAHVLSNFERATNSDIKCDMDPWKWKIQRTFMEGNRQLADKYNLHLNKWIYPL